MDVVMYHIVTQQLIFQLCTLKEKESLGVVFYMEA